jgi:hypothetical protein
METVNGTSLNGSSPKGSWLTPATWSLDGTDLTVLDAGWIETEHREPVAVPEVGAPPAVDQQAWPSPENFEAEQARLEAAIASAKERAAAAKIRIAVRQAKIEEALRVERAEFEESLAALERQHEETLATIGADARAEVDRILAGAAVNDAD